MSEAKTRMKLFQVVGRKAPTKTDENPPAFRMKLFAVNQVIAKSRFWYFMHQMRKMKKTTGEILDVNEVCENCDSWRPENLGEVFDKLLVRRQYNVHIKPFNLRSPRRTAHT